MFICVTNFIYLFMYVFIYLLFIIYFLGFVFIRTLFHKQTNDSVTNINARALGLRPRHSSDAYN